VLDFLICDIKLIDEEAHRNYTGQSNRLILDNFRRFARRFGGVLVRVPLIPGITAEEKNLTAVGELVRSSGPDITIELLNYNWFSGSKYARLNMPHFNDNARAFSNEEMDRFYSWAGIAPEVSRQFRVKAATLPA
jgi:pyruvate formate lyase activating enzyme